MNDSVVNKISFFLTISIFLIFMSIILAILYGFNQTQAGWCAQNGGKGVYNNFGWYEKCIKE